VFNVEFSAPENRKGGRGPTQEGACTTPAGEKACFTVNDERGDPAHGVRVFAGPRWDPFIMDALAALETISTGKLAFTDPGAIYLDGKNVLSLVVEFDCAMLGDAALVGVVAETLTRGKLSVRFERTGRPEVKNLMLAPKQFDQVNRDLEIRDLYNAEDAFGLSQAYLGAYRARLNANLAFWDSLDGQVDWPADESGAHPLTELLLADFSWWMSPSRTPSRVPSWRSSSPPARAAHIRPAVGGPSTTTSWTRSSRCSSTPGTARRSATLALGGASRSRRRHRRL
jgi:hypothetical protein